MTNNLKKKSDALVMAYIIEKASPQFIGSHKCLLDTIGAMTQEYHFAPDDPLTDTEFANLVNSYARKIEEEQTAQTVSLLFRSRFKIAI